MSVGLCYFVRVYNDDDVLIDVVGDFDTEEDAQQWIRDYCPDDCYASILIKVI